MCSEVSARALRIMRRVAEKQPEMFQTCLASGLKVTADFHERIRSNYRASTSHSAGINASCIALQHHACLKGTLPALRLGLLPILWLAPQCHVCLK